MPQFGETSQSRVSLSSSTWTWRLSSSSTMPASTPPTSGPSRRCTRRPRRAGRSSARSCWPTAPTPPSGTRRDSPLWTWSRSVSWVTVTVFHKTWTLLFWRINVVIHLFPPFFLFLFSFSSTLSSSCRPYLPFPPPLCLTIFLLLLLLLLLLSPSPPYAGG